MTTTIEKRISAVRKVLKKARLEALLVPTGDPHMSEYLPENWAFRRWLTGFTGSAGTLVVTAEKALLWTDSRYWEQAAKETEATGITVMKSGAADVPDVRVWLAENLPENASVGLDCSTVSAERLRLLENTVSHRGIGVVDTGNLIDKLWTDRPGRSEAPVRPFTTAQKPAAEKSRTCARSFLSVRPMRSFFPRLTISPGSPISEAVTSFTPLFSSPISF